MSSNISSYAAPATTTPLQILSSAPVPDSEIMIINSAEIAEPTKPDTVIMSGLLRSMNESQRGEKSEVKEEPVDSEDRVFLAYRSI